MSDEIIEPAAPALPPESARVQALAGARPSREDGRPAAPTRTEERRDPEEAGSVGLPAGRDGGVGEARLEDADSPRDPVVPEPRESEARLVEG